MKKLTYADIEHLPHDHPDSIEFMNQIKQVFPKDRTITVYE